MKYKQPGYRDGERREERTQSSAAPKRERDAPRLPKIPVFHQVIRCAMCGVPLPPSFGDISALSQCPKCKADLHTCRNCVYFDPSTRFECSQPIPARVVRKGNRNSCEFFEIRTRVEKETTSSAPRPSLDPREAFERLFKK